MRVFFELQTSSTMFVAVTEPKSVPVSPAGASKRSSSASSLATISCACSTLCASCLARFSSCLRTSATLAGVAVSASLRGSRKLRA